MSKTRSFALKMTGLFFAFLLAAGFLAHQGYFDLWAAILVGALAELAQPYLMKLAIDGHIARGRLAGLDRLAAIYLATLIVAFAAEYGQTWGVQIIGQRIMFDLRSELYAKLQRLDVRYYDRNPVGRLMTRVTSDVDVLNDLFTSGVVTIFGDAFTLIGIMVVMLGMNWRLALVAFTVLPLILLVTQWFRRNVRQSYRIVRGLIARINAHAGAQTVKALRFEQMLPPVAPLPVGSFPVFLLGFGSTQVDLGSLGLPGCTQWVTADAKIGRAHV